MLCELERLSKNLYLTVFVLCEQSLPCSWLWAYLMLLPERTNDDPVNIDLKQSEPHMLTRQARQYLNYLETCVKLTTGTGRGNIAALLSLRHTGIEIGLFALGSRVVE